MFPTIGRSNKKLNYQENKLRVFFPFSTFNRKEISPVTFCCSRFDDDKSISDNILRRFLFLLDQI